MITLKTEDQQKRWGRIRNAFDHFSLEDTFTLRKAIELKQIDMFWELGLIHISRLELLAREFRYDATIQKIYQEMLVRVNDRMKFIIDRGTDLDIDDVEYMFKDQPFVYNDRVTDINPRTILYNVKRCKYKLRLESKYPKLYDVIEDMVNMG